MMTFVRPRRVEIWVRPGLEGDFVEIKKLTRCNITRYTAPRSFKIEFQSFDCTNFQLLSDLQDRPFDLIGAQEFDRVYGVQGRVVLTSIGSSCDAGNIASFNFEVASVSVQEFGGLPTTCRDCQYFHNHDSINCAIHPAGPTNGADNCPDFSPQNSSSQP